MSNGIGPAMERVPDGEPPDRIAAWNLAFYREVARLSADDQDWMMRMRREAQRLFRP